MRYFISDLHFGHAFVAALRGFSDFGTSDQDAIKKIRQDMSSEEFISHVDQHEHDEYLIEVINQTVTANDELYILGDLGLSTARGFMLTASKLCLLNVPARNRHLIIGNHDGKNITQTMKDILGPQFADIQKLGIISFEKDIVILTHHPSLIHYDQMRIATGITSNATDLKSQKSSLQIPEDLWHLYGHTHSKNPYEFGCKKHVNVGIDAWGKPASELDIFKKKG